MDNILFIPVINDKQYQKYKKTIENLPNPSKYNLLLEPSIKTKVQNNGGLCGLWGLNASNYQHGIWNLITPGDTVVFYNNKKLIKKGTILGKQQESTIAYACWSNITDHWSDKDILIIKDLVPINYSISPTQLGYSPNYNLSRTVLFENGTPKYNVIDRIIHNIQLNQQQNVNQPTPSTGTNFQRKNNTNLSNISGNFGQYTTIDKPIVGGEGKVFKTSNGKRIKIYSEKTLAQHDMLESKIKFMQKNPPGQDITKYLAWPIDIAYIGNKFSGFVMNELEGFKELRNLNAYSVKSNISLKLKMNVAYRLAWIVDVVHKGNYVIGDFNPKNIGYIPQTNSKYHMGEICIYDNDSFQFENSGTKYKCEVMFEGYVAPEIYDELDNYEKKYGKKATVHDLNNGFSKQTDYFALAVHIFRLMMNGFMPYSAISINENIKHESEKSYNDCSSWSLPSQNENQKNDIFCYTKGYMPIQVAVPPEDKFPRYITSLFQRAFKHIGSEESRPTATEWLDALDHYSKDVILCKQNPNHIYWKELKSCPYCEANERFKLKRSGSKINYREIYDDISSIGSLTLPKGKYYGSIIDGLANGKGTLTTDLGTFTGTFENNQRSGHFTVNFHNSESFEGEYRNDKKNGYGEYHYANGSVFKGNFVNNRKQGKGTLIDSDGKTIHEGTFNDGKMSDGVVILPDGSRCTGDIVDNNISGEGEITWPNGNLYVGEIEHNVAEGYGFLAHNTGLKRKGIFNQGLFIEGSITRPDKAIIFGPILNEEVTGQGKIILPNGDYYIGSIENNIASGVGKYVMSDDISYIGNFINGVITGIGEKHLPDGTVLKGTFDKDGNIVEKRQFTAPDGSYYEGTFVDGVITGQGIKKWNNLEYNGNFVNGQFEGIGHITSDEGLDYYGSFSKGTIKGHGRFKLQGNITIEGLCENNHVIGTATKYWPDGTCCRGELDNWSISGVGVK